MIHRQRCYRSKALHKYMQELMASTFLSSYGQSTVVNAKELNWNEDELIIHQEHFAYVRLSFGTIHCSYRFQ